MSKKTELTYDTDTAGYSSNIDIVFNSITRGIKPSKTPLFNRLSVCKSNKSVKGSSMKIKIIKSILSLIPNNLIVTLIDAAVAELTKKLTSSKKNKYRKATINVLKGIVREAGKLDIKVKPDEVTVGYSTKF